MFIALSNYSNSAQTTFTLPSKRAAAFTAVYSVVHRRRLPCHLSALPRSLQCTLVVNRRRLPCHLSVLPRSLQCILVVQRRRLPCHLSMLPRSLQCSSSAQTTFTSPSEHAAAFTAVYSNCAQTKVR